MTIEQLTIVEVNRLLDTKQLSIQELIEAFIQRYADVEPQINAWAYAQKADDLREMAQQMAQNQKRASVLTGIPYGAKDIIYTKGIPTEAGSKTLKGYVPDRDATVIQRLTKAGGILFGKTTTAEFASGGGAPPTCNPWNLAHTPGGSSTGSAAAVASGMSLFALGTQTSGSVIRPGAYTGVTALKPTFGQISKSGIIPASWSIDTVGIFTKTVADVRLVYNELIGRDIRDETTFSAKQTPLSLRNNGSYRIGVVRQDYFEGSPEVMRAFNEAVRLLKTSGGIMEECQLPANFEGANEAHGIVVDSETAMYHQASYQHLKEQFSPELQGDIEAGLGYSASDYLQAQQCRWEYQQELFRLLNRVDVLVTPATPETAPKGLASTGSPKFNKPFSNAGVPVLTFPIGFDRKTGLPIGIQLIANRHSEQILIDIGHKFQMLTDFHLKRPKLTIR